MRTISGEYFFIKHEFVCKKKKKKKKVASRKPARFIKLVMSFKSRLILTYGDKDSGNRISTRFISIPKKKRNEHRHDLTESLIKAQLRRCQFIGWFIRA